MRSAIGTDLAADRIASRLSYPNVKPSPDVADHPARILIVDDERPDRHVLEVMLGLEGFCLLTAASGDEALAMVAQQPPDLMLLDVMMPGMDGYQVAGKLKGNLATKNIPIIMVTAVDDRNGRMLGLSAGAEDFLTKPVDRAELCVRVRNLLRLKAYRDYQVKYSQMLECEVRSRTTDLVESERLYRSTFDAAPVGIVHVGLDGQWLHVNQRLCDLLGYSREELQSRAVQQVMQAEEVAGEAESFRQMVAGTLDRHVVDEKRYRRRDGSVMLARVNMSVHRDAEGHSQHVISVIEDITEQRTLEAQVRQANKMDAIGRLASGVAHDFNNLLTVILGYAELMTTDVAMASQHGKDLGEIIKATHCAKSLTTQLLAFSRQQVLHAVPLDVNELIMDMARMIGRLIGEDVEVALALAPNLSLALADRGQLEQVVMNLVVNARDAMPGGGRVTIETADVELDNSYGHEQAIVEGRYVMLAITDTGSGMTKDTQRRLFEPFFTTKETGKGTGLGLSTTYGIVKQSKGYIWVYSEPGRGTTFKIYWPRSTRDAPLPVFGSVVTGPVRVSSETVLLVEDEAGVRELAKRILDHAGYQVLEAANGDEAERVFARHADAIDVVVTDVVMPGCGGPELLSRLQVHAPALRVLYMSGYTEQSAAHEAGIDRGLPFVQKPFTAAELVRQVRRALAGHAAKAGRQGAPGVG
jgi:two-component system cell cycle sensor histidine kinase/response regulator CckA